jgi:hypothetical protein
MWVGIRSIFIGSVDGFVYANNHRQIPELVNEPAQPHQSISITSRRGYVSENIALTSMSQSDVCKQYKLKRYSRELAAPSPPLVDGESVAVDREPSIDSAPRL